MLLNLLDSGTMTIGAAATPVKAAEFPCQFVMLWPASGTHVFYAGIAGVGKQGIYIPAFANVATYLPISIYADDANKIVVTGTENETLGYALFG